MGRWEENADPDSGIPWLWASLFWKMPWQTGCCLVPQDFIELLVTAQCLGPIMPSLGQQLARSSDCLLCYSPFFLTRLSGHFWLPACGFFPVGTSHLTRTSGRWRVLLFSSVRNASRLHILMEVTQKSGTKPQQGKKEHEIKMRLYQVELWGTWQVWSLQVHMSFSSCDPLNSCQTQ